MSNNFIISLSKYANIVKQEQIKSNNAIYLESMISQIKNNTNPNFFVKSHKQASIK